MKSGIYSILINNKRYIGSSINMSKRTKYHLSRLKNNKHFNKHLQNAYNLYLGVLVIEILEYCDDTKLMEREKYYIDFHSVLNNKHGYNAAPNPFQGSRGVKWNKDSKEMLSDTLKLQYKNGDRKISMLSHTDEAKVRISEKLMGHDVVNRRSILCHQNNTLYSSLHAAAKALNMCVSSICDVLKKRRNSCKGYTFEYKEVT